MTKYKLDAVMTALFNAEGALKELLETESTISEIIDDLTPEETKALYKQCDAVEDLIKKF